MQLHQLKLQSCDTQYTFASHIHYIDHLAIVGGPIGPHGHMHPIKCMSLSLIQACRDDQD